MGLTGLQVKPAFSSLFSLVPPSKDVFGPEKNAALSRGVGSDGDLLCPVIVRACEYPAASTGPFFPPFTAVRRCRPGVRCCSGRCGCDRRMGRKAPGLWIYGSSGLWVIWCSLRSEVRDAGRPTLYYSAVWGKPWTEPPATCNCRAVTSLTLKMTLLMASSTKFIVKGHWQLVSCEGELPWLLKSVSSKSAEKPTKVNCGKTLQWIKSLFSTF